MSTNKNILWQVESEVKKKRKTVSRLKTVVHSTGWKDGVIFFLLAVILSFYIAWRSAADEINQLTILLASENAQLQKEAEKSRKLDIFRKAMNAAISPDEKAWGQEHNLHKVQFYVLDSSGSPIPGVSVCAINTELVTKEGGLTSAIWIASGKKVSVTKAGYARQEILLDNVMIGDAIVNIELRSLNHVEKS